jgi:hypothetical protein
MPTIPTLDFLENQFCPNNNFNLTENAKRYTPKSS